MTEKIVNKRVDELIPYDNNPRRNALAIDPVAESIKRFKFRNPIIIDKNNVVVAGHTRLLASQKLGIEEVPCIVIDDMSQEEINAYRLADNKTSEFATWDEDKLKKELMELEESGFDDMESIGFSDIERMMIIGDEEETSEYEQDPLDDKKSLKDYEQHADEEVLSSFNIILGCYTEEDKEWVSKLIGEDGKLKRFYEVRELRERGLI